MGEMMREVNGLTETLRHPRLSAVEATALLKRMLAEIDVAVIGIDTHGSARGCPERARSAPRKSRCRPPFPARVALGA